MQLSELLDYTLGAVINTMCYVIIMKRVFCVQLNSNKTKIYIPMLVGSIIIAIINIQNKDMLKPLFTIPIMALSTSFIINQKFSKTFIMIICSMFYLLLSEVLLSVILSLLNIKSFIIIDNIFGSSIGNILVAIFVIPFLYIKQLKKYLKKLVEWIENGRNLGILIIVLFFAGTFLSRNSYKNYESSEIIMNVILIITFVIIVYLLFNEYQKTLELSNNYNMLFSYLKVYEKELTEKRKIVHDYNNQLIVINSYVSDENENLKKYINLIIKDQKKITDSAIIKNTDNLPVGLKGLIYYKIATLPENIKVNVDVDSNLKDIVIKDELSYDYLKITGVFLDNAIEAACESKEKFISIKVKLNNRIMNLEIINSFSGIVDENKIYNSGYSTKGEKRGYGLILVKEILKKQNKIKIAIKIKKNQFIAIQNIKICK